MTHDTAKAVHGEADLNASEKAYMGQAFSSIHPKVEIVMRIVDRCRKSGGYGAFLPDFTESQLHLSSNFKRHAGASEAGLELRGFRILADCGSLHAGETERKI